MITLRFSCPMIVCVILASATIYGSETQNPPVLISEVTSTRAIALESATFMREPFLPVSPYAWSLGQQTRVMLFALNLNLQPGEDASVVTADAEDASHQHYNLKVEAVAPVPLMQWMSAVVLRLSDNLGDVGDVLVRITYRGLNSNRVRIGIGHVGGGPPDDDGAAPTPAPPYIISGQIKSGTQGLGGVSVTLSGAQTGTVVTDENGLYSLTVNATGDYSLTPSKTYYNFSPASQSFTNLSNHQSNINFTATRQTFNISGKVTDNAGNGLSNLTVNLSGALDATRTTDTSGNYSFTGLPAGNNYTVALAQNAFYNFTSQSFNNLTSDQTANFTGTLRTYTINGRVTNGANGFGGVTVTLSGTQSATVTTDADGNYSFANLVATGNYLLTPSRVNYNFTPTAQSFNNLGQAQTANFSGTLNSYTLSGRITDAQSNGLGDVTLALSGSQTGTVQTDAAGNYSFTVLAEGNYTITPSKQHYLFNPQQQSFNSLGGNQTAAFSAALRQYTISGYVADSNGQKLPGVTLTLSGSQTGTIKTSSDGSYSFSATALGNYSVTPSVEQDYYSYAPPAQTFSSLTGDQSLNFAASLAPLPNPFSVLEFDGSPKSVEYGHDYWPSLVDLGPCYWEFWAMPDSNAAGGYLISDGYGGAHAVLFGINYAVAGRYRLTGNMWDGETVNYFGSGEGPAPNEWAHLAVGYDGKSIIAYEDGVPVGKQPFSGPRISPGGAWGATWLLIGGSDHSNFSGRIAQVRGYEGIDPRASAPESSFAPQTLFSTGGQMLSYYFKPASVVADLSLGFNGTNHTGKVRGTANGIGFDCTGCPTPQFVVDQTAPDFAHPDQAGQINGMVDRAPAPPSGALIFDSFSRPNATYILNGLGGLSQTEKGSLSWQTGTPATERQPFGILNGRAVLLADSQALAWVDAGSSDLEVRVDRFIGGDFGDGVDTGLSFRIMDASNYFFAYTSESNQSSGTETLTVGYYQNGQRTNLTTGVSVPVNWTTLRVVTRSTGVVAVYADSIPLYSTSSNLLATATKAGLYNDAPGLGLVNRWDNFTIFHAP